MIDVLFEDKDLIVVVKPSNMPCQRDFSRTPDLEGEVSKHIGKKAFLIHRLDRHVEGPLVLAKTKEGAKALNAQLRGEGFTKIYKAVVVNVEGKELEKEHGIKLCHYMTKEKSISIVIDEQTFDLMDEIKKKPYKKAVMEIFCLNESKDKEESFALYSVKLQTGRFHQIRSQLSFIGLPILGDPKYGVKKLGDVVYNGIGLQCVQLGFKHPVSGKILTFNSQHQRDGFKLFT